MCNRRSPEKLTPLIDEPVTRKGTLLRVQRIQKRPDTSNWKNQQALANVRRKPGSWCRTTGNEGGRETPQQNLRRRKVGHLKSKKRDKRQQRNCATRRKPGLNWVGRRVKKNAKKGTMKMTNPTPSKGPFKKRLEEYPGDQYKKSKEETATKTRPAIKRQTTGTRVTSKSKKAQPIMSERERSGTQPAHLSLCKEGSKPALLQYEFGK